MSLLSSFNSPQAKQFNQTQRAPSFMASIRSLRRARGVLSQGKTRKRRRTLVEASVLKVDATSAEIDPAAEEKELDRRIALSATSLALTLSGTFINPVFTAASLPFLLYLNYDFISRGIKELVYERRVGLATVDGITTSSVLLFRLYNIDAIFFLIYSISQKLLHSTRDHVQQELVNIIGDQPHTVWVEREGVEVSIPFEALQVDDVIVVHTGEMIPIDGIVVSGGASVDQRMLTGESVPAEKESGQSVFAATIVQSGTLRILVQKQGSDTVAAQIGSILNQTADYKSTVESRAEVFCEQTAVPSLAISGITLMLLGPQSAIAVLLAYIGYNMRLIAPISVLNYLRIAAKNSVLVKDGRALELLRDVDTVVFDKTGTLTEDRPKVGKIYTLNGYDADTVLTYAAAAEYKQTHPIALAILQAAQMKHLSIPPQDDASYALGLGLQVKIANKVVHIGSERFIEAEGIHIPKLNEQAKHACQQKGFSLVYVAIDGEAAGIIELQPTLRPEAKQVVEALKARGLDLYIISGDQEAPTRHLAQQLGITNYFAETLPENKAALLQQLQDKGASVCFIGDGINDSISLKKANVSISLQGASTIAVDTAQIILMSGSLEKLPYLFELAEQLDNNMKGNLVASVAPGVVTIAGVYFLNLGILAACMLYNVGLLSGVANAMLPAIVNSRQETMTTPQAEDVSVIAGQ